MGGQTEEKNCFSSVQWARLREGDDGQSAGKEYSQVREEGSKHRDVECSGGWRRRRRWWRWRGGGVVVDFELLQ